MSLIYQFERPLLNGSIQPLSQFQGQVLLIVNTATHCHFSPQLAQLEKLYQQYHAQGFAILGFPCHQFGQSQRLPDPELLAYCSNHFDVHFPLFKPVQVQGLNSDPLFDHLKQHARGLLKSRAIKWNFTKFLVDRQGAVVARYAPRTKPAAMAKAIENLL